MYLTVKKQRDVLNQGYDINVWISDRSGRKSSVTQETLIEEALLGKPFILLRSKKDELINENWLSEYVVNKYKDYIFYTEKINANITSIKFKTPDDKVYLLCYGLYLSLAQKYKSSYYEGFEDVKYVVWEECIPNSPILQNIKHIRARCMNEINSVLSIGSTIARDNKIQYIWLGNDIKENILNPVTISFNLIERLTDNMELAETVTFNDREYSYYFNYFDFDGAVNHWLYNENLHICNNLSDYSDIDTFNIIKYNVQLRTKYKNYYLYNCGNFIHISDIDYTGAQTMTSGIYTIEDFFKKFNAHELYVKYPISTALSMLCTFYGCNIRTVNNYFGKDWYKGVIKFTGDDITDDTVIIELDSIVNLSLAELMRRPEYNELKNINELRKSSTVTYSNMYIYLLIEELGNILLFT